MEKSKRLSAKQNGLTALHLNSILFILVLITVYPFLLLALNSLGVTAENSRPNLRGYLDVFQEGQFGTALSNTIVMALAVTLLSLAVGGSLSWLLNKTDLKKKKVFDFLIFLSYMTPSYILAVAMIEILGPVGILAKFFGGVAGTAKMPWNIYSLSGVVLVMTIHLYPLAYMAVSNALKGCERSLEEAAFLDGAGPVNAFFKIILPAIMPSVFSAALFIFAHSSSSFGVAALLALPARKYILPTYIYSALSGLNLPKATAVSILLSLLTGSLYLLQRPLADGELKLVPGDNYGDLKVKLNRFRIAAALGLWLFFTVTIVLPLTVIVVTSFLKVWGLQWIPENFTLDNYRQLLFVGPRILKAIVNSAVFGFIAASVATIIGSLALYIGIRFGGYKGKLIDFLLSWPMVIPEIVLAVAAILAWINPPLKLYGTPWIIIVTYITASLPLVIRNVRGLIDSLDPELEETAWTFGASTLTGFKKIVIPLIKPGLKAGWICSFLFTLHEIPVSTLLAAPGTETVGVVLFGLRSDTGGLEMISALAVIILLVVIGGRTAIKRMT